MIPRCPRTALLCALAVSIHAIASSRNSWAKLPTPIEPQGETLDREIRTQSSRLQTSCDKKRLRLKADFLEKVFLPVRNEMDFILSLVSEQQKSKLDENLKLLLSEKNEIRASAIERTSRILKEALNRSAIQLHLKSEIVEGNPLPFLRVTGQPTHWQNQRVQFELLFSAKPGDSEFQLRERLLGVGEFDPATGKSRNGFQEAVETALPIECRIFLTGLDPNKLYSFPLTLPIFRAENELADPNQILSLLNNPARGLEKASPRIHSGESKSPGENAPISASTTERSTAAPGI